MKRHHLLFFIAILSFLSFSCNRTKNTEPVTEEDYNSWEEIVEFPTPSNAAKPEEDLSGNLIVLSEDDFTTMITDIDNPKGFQYKGRTPCVVEFYTDWCHPCILLNSILIELGEEYKSRVIFYKINAEKGVRVASAFNVNAVPTLILCNPPASFTKIEGFVNKEELKTAIENVLLTKK